MTSSLAACSDKLVLALHAQGRPDASAEAVRRALIPCPKMAAISQATRTLRDKDMDRHVTR